MQKTQKWAKNTKNVKNIETDNAKTGKQKRIEMDEKMQNGASIVKGKGNCRIAKESRKN